MANDPVIAKFIYQQAPPTYQVSRYIDWILPYLEQQRAETEKNSTYTYMKNKFEAILKCLQLYAQFEEKYANKFREEEKQQWETLQESGKFTNLDTQEDWLAYSNPDVIKHFPP